VPAGCAVEREANGGLAVTFNVAKTSVAPCGSSAGSVSGTTKSLVELHLALDKASDQVTITLVGPATVWFGVGFNASEMSDSPWAVIVDGTGAVTERKLVDQKAGSLLKTTGKVVQNTVEDGVRSVILTRSLKGAGPSYYTFDPEGPARMNFINAIGSGPAFAYHRLKDPSSLTLLPVAAPACVCGKSAMTFGNGACKGRCVRDAPRCTPHALCCVLVWPGY
jgi:hypothetical protein